jgi:trimethylamine--corrinoid protein Co-methyltransferase
LPAYAGADILSGGGNYESSTTIDLVQLVIDDEIFGMIARVMRGIEVNDDTLGLEAIRRVGAGTEKTYLTDKHTLKYFRTEYFKPKTFTRSLRATWESEGAKDLSERAKERVNRILKEYKPVPLPEAVAKEMRLISENAEREITEVTTI